MSYFYEEDDEEEEQSGGLDVGGGHGDYDQEGNGDVQDEQQGGQNLDPEQIKNDMQNTSDNLDNKNGNNGDSGDSKFGSGEGEKGKEGQNSGENGKSKNGDSPNSSSSNNGNYRPNNANNTSMNSGQAAQGAAQNATQEAAKESAKEATKEGAKQAAKEGAKEAGKQVAKEAGKKSAIAALGPVLFYAAIIVLGLIVIIGIVAFILLMPGQIIDKLTEIGQSFMEKMNQITKGQENLVGFEEIANVANYLEKMGYDLMGEGFVTDKVWNSESEAEARAPISSDYPDDFDISGSDFDWEQWLYRNGKGEVIKIYSDPIKTYIVSDNLCYIIKNNNSNFNSGSGGAEMGWWMALAGAVCLIGAALCVICPVAGLAAIAGGAAIFGFTLNNGNPNWGTGLISLYHEGDRVGDKGGYYSGNEAGSITLDMKTKKLKVQRGWVGSGYDFDIDGWSGRYGMPLEFLLSVHIATQMPDLAIEMATAFDTDVQVLLHSLDDVDVEAGFLIHDLGAIKDANLEDADMEDEIRNVMGSLGNMDYLKWGDVTELIKLREMQKDDKNFFDYWISGWNTICEWTDEKLGEWIDGDKGTINIMDDWCYYTLIIRGLPHASDCTCCSHIPSSKKWKEIIEAKNNNPNIEIEPESCEGVGNLYLGKSDEFSLGDGSNKHVICESCKKNIDTILVALKRAQNQNLRTYTPYISQVKDHWFRDLYFVIDNLSVGPSGLGVIMVDDDYYEETGERWTQFERYTEDDEINGNIPEGFNEGDYKLYTIDGYPSEFSWQVVDFINEKIEDGYTDYTDVLDEINRKIDEGDSSFSKLKDKINNGETEIIRLVKKPVTKTLKNIANSTPDDEDYIEFSGINLSENRWVAYESTESTNTGGEWKMYNVTDDSPDELNIFKKDEFKGKLWYKEDRPGDIIQIEDGQRDVTNSKIKRMFTQNKYYKYDGTVERAQKIIDDRKKPDDEKDESLKSRVSINKDSLSAFSMLENTHTLDADYIYKDFKELIVELNYFDPEDLSDAMSEVMTWILPETGSNGWPIRKYEKSDVFYGTLIHSKEDLRLIKQDEVLTAKDIMKTLREESGARSTANITPNNKIPTTSIGELVNFGYDMHDDMEGKGWSYGSSTYNTFDLAQANNKISSSASYINWILEKAGFDLSNNSNIHGALSTFDWCEAEDWITVTDYGSLEPGDLIFTRNALDSDIANVQMMGNNREVLSTISTDAINSEPKTSSDTTFIIGMRSLLNNSTETFDGYEPDEPVVAPITGKIIGYGVIGGTGEHAPVERENVETGETEEVEYIKIQAMDHYIYNDKGRGYKDCKSADDVFEEKVTNTDRKNKEGYDYFFEEYQGVMKSYVLYIEGFNLTFFDAGGEKSKIENGDNTSKDVTRYEANEVKNLTNDIKEAQAYWKEDAKVAAVPFFEDDKGNMYIKEGTVIGKTSTDASATSNNIKTRTIVDDAGNESEVPVSNGNYIRLILRNIEDSIVEDIENYFTVKDDEDNNIDYELFYWLPFETEALDGNHEGKEYEFASVYQGNIKVEAGIVKWKNNDISEKFIKECLNQNFNLCLPLKAYKTWTTSEFWSDWNGNREFRKTLEEINDTDSKKFSIVQMNIAKKQYLKPLLEKYPWLESRPACVKGALMNLNLYGVDMRWLSLGNWENKTDHALLDEIGNKLKNVPDIDSARVNNEVSIAKRIINGWISLDELKVFVEDNDPSGLGFDFE